MRGKVKSRQQTLREDHKYESKKVSKLINYVMQDGEKNVARRIVHDAFEYIKDEKGVDDPVEIFTKALENVGPHMEVRSRRIGGANYQVPYEVKPDRRIQLALRWIVDIARSKKSEPMHKSLAEELMVASEGEGAAVKKKEQSHKMAEANKAFAHFAW